METLDKISDVTYTVSDTSDLADIYEQVFPVVARFISSVGGSFDDAKDIFHDALVIFMEKDSSGKECVIISDKAYILGISKHLWLRKQRKDSRNVPLNNIENKIAIPDDYFPTTTQRRLLRFLKITGKRCLDLLRAFYFQEQTIQEIARDFGYSHEHSVSVQKYKCLEKVRSVVKEKSITYEDFAE